MSSGIASPSYACAAHTASSVWMSQPFAVMPEPELEPEPEPPFESPFGLRLRSTLDLPAVALLGSDGSRALEQAPTASNVPMPAAIERSAEAEPGVRCILRNGGLA